MTHRRPTIVLKHNNCATNDPCALCGARTDPVVGLDFFLAGTWALVCDGCAEAHAPGLLPLRNAGAWDAEPGEPA